MEEDYSLPLSPLPSMEAEELQTYCGQGHRSSLRVQTTEGGSICLVCLSNLLSNPTSPPLHLSYALSQLSLAIEDPLFLQSLRSFHTHLLVPPLVHALSSFSDNSLACQIVDLIADLSRSSRAIASDFIVRITNLLSSGSLAWSRQQIYTLHCLGILLNHPTDGSPSTYIKDKGALISSLLEGLQLPSEKIHGEVLFVLYKLSTLQDAEEDYFSFSCPKLLSLSLQALMKTQNDDVRLNCIALLTMLARTQNFEFGSSLTEDPSSHYSREEIVMPRTELMAGTSLVLLFADAIKGPLLSSDAQVQISALDLIFHSISSEASSAKQIQKLVEESIADYVFEVLRLSGNRDPLVVSCIRVLHLLATAEEAITQSLAIGFPTLLPALHHVAEMPLHPSQFQTLKLVWICISHCPGIISTSQAEETIMLLAEIFKRHGSGEMGLLPETFTMACSTFVTLLKLPCSLGIPSIAASIQEVLRSAVSSSLCLPRRYPNQVLLYSLYLLKEAYAYNQEHDTTIDMENMHSANYIIEICETHILPWLSRAIDEAEEEEEIILGVLETLHSVLLQRSDIHAKKFAEILASSYWFSLSFGCLGLFPSDQMKLRVYLMLSSIIDRILGNEFGQPIRDSASCLPQDPLDLLFLLEQRSSYNSDLISCQSAVILILYTSSLHNERLADDKQVLASLEQYILVNRTSFLHGIVDSSTLTQLVHLYGFIRGADKNYQTSYCVEAENLLFHVLAEKEWDLLSTRIHPLALKWLFKQEKIREPLSSQILNFCRFNLKSKSEIIGDESSNTQLIDTKAIAGLVADGDNCGPSVLVSLLKELHEAGQSDDIASVMNLMIGILNIFPAASNQFCLHGIIGVVHSLYCSTHSSATLSRRCSLLVFNILRFADPKMLSDKEAWVLVTTKLLDYLVPTLTADDTCNQDMHLVMGILSLILSQCSNQTLTEASKAILLNKPLASAVNNVIQAACVKGPALIDHDEEPGIGETLTSVLLLYFFSLRSLHALLEGTVEWQDFLESSNGTQPLSVICICCHDLCRLIHFGASPIKLVASQCLLELLTKISDQRTTKLDEFQCSMKYLKSMMAVLEGLIFYGQNKVAMNCSLCLSRIIGWEKLSVQHKKEIQEDRWFRLIMEELALSLTAPSLASKSFTNQHKPATHIAISLLEMDQEHKWIRSVLNSSCISGIISNLSASNVSGEMVELFRQLLACEYLNEEHIMGLNNVFQACRKRLYMEGYQENYREQHFEKVLAIPDDLGKICSLLIHLMSSPTEASTGVQTERKRLLEEIEMFSQEYSTRT